MLKEAQTHKNVNGRRVFIVVLSFITAEAQHALLKMFEEPSSDSLFFFVVPSRGAFIPTVLSRACVVGCGDSLALKGVVDMEMFLSGSSASRFALLEPLIEEKDKRGALAFLNELQTALFKGAAKDDAEKAFVLNEIESCRNYLNSRAPSVKMILEHIALVTPRL